jgi:hypothetical protein
MKTLLALLMGSISFSLFANPSITIAQVDENYQWQFSWSTQFSLEPLNANQPVEGSIKIYSQYGKGIWISGLKKGDSEILRKELFKLASQSKINIFLKHPFIQEASNFINISIENVEIESGGNTQPLLKILKILRENQNRDSFGQFGCQWMMSPWP